MLHIKKLYAVIFAVIIFGSGIITGRVTLHDSYKGDDKLTKFNPEIINNNNLDLSNGEQNFKEYNSKNQLPEYIKNSLIKAELPTVFPDESTWNEFLEKIKVQNIQELEKEYNFDFLSNYISGTGKLPPDEFFDRFGYDLTASNETNRSILMSGVKNLHFDDFKKLIDMGIDLSLVEGEKGTANIINYALRSPIQAENKLKLLLENGYTFENGKNYLRDAIKASNQYKISLTTFDKILRNTDPNSSCPPYNQSAFSSVLTLNGSKKSIDYFLDNGFDFSNIKHPSKILTLACVNKNVTGAHYQKLIDIAGGLDSLKNQNYSLLSMAIHFNRPDLIKVLLKNNAAIDDDIYRRLENLERSQHYSKGEPEEMRKLFEGKI